MVDTIKRNGSGHEPKILGVAPPPALRATPQPELPEPAVFSEVPWLFSEALAVATMIFLNALNNARLHRFDVPTERALDLVDLFTGAFEDVPYMSKPDQASWEGDSEELEAVCDAFVLAMRRVERDHRLHAESYGKD